MKGQLLNDSLLYQLEVRGESWLQGQVVQGQLKIKNNGPEAKEVPLTGVALATGEFRKVHANGAKALKFEQTEKIQREDRQPLAPGEEISCAFRFTLDPNCLITDKKGSYFISYGPEMQGSQLQIVITPRPLFQQIAECVERFYRFQIKEVARGVTYKMKGPSSREYAHLDSLELTIQSEGDDIILDFKFALKKITVSSSVTKMVKTTNESTHRLAPRDYSLGGDKVSLDQDKILELIKNVLQKVKLNIF